MISATFPSPIPQIPLARGGNLKIDRTLLREFGGRIESGGNRSLFFVWLDRPHTHTGTHTQRHDWSHNHKTVHACKDARDHNRTVLKKAARPGTRGCILQSNCSQCSTAHTWQSSAASMAAATNHVVSSGSAQRKVHLRSWLAHRRRRRRSGGGIGRRSRGGRRRAHVTQRVRGEAERVAPHLGAGRLPEHVTRVDRKSTL